jgi:hypothetical protein
MFNACQQPWAIALGEGMTGQLQPVTAAQRRQITATFGSLRSRRIGLGNPLQLPLVQGRRRVVFLVLEPIPRDTCQWQLRRIIGEHQTVPVAVVFKVVVNPRLRAYALEQLQVGLAVLGAERADRVIATQFETALGTDDPVFPEHLFNDLRHRTATEDALAEA